MPYGLRKSGCRLHGPSSRYGFESVEGDWREIELMGCPWAFRDVAWSVQFVAMAFSTLEGNVAWIHLTGVWNTSYLSDDWN